MVDYRELSRLLSHALRHEPWLYELELDEQGWAPVSAVLAAVQAQGPEWANATEADIAETLRTSSKQRHEMRDGRIRALYGHSTPEKLTKEPAAPPAELFHGTAPEVVKTILTEGLRPMGRQYVHLSANLETAIQVGKRKAAQPVILRVDAAEASAAGTPFYAGNAAVWLADRVGPEYLSIFEPSRID